MSVLANLAPDDGLLAMSAHVVGMLARAETSRRGMLGEPWAMRWKPALNAFAITFEGRINPAGN